MVDQMLQNSTKQCFAFNEIIILIQRIIYIFKEIIISKYTYIYIYIYIYSTNYLSIQQKSYYIYIQRDN